jgi:hypothetical protein
MFPRLVVAVALNTIAFSSNEVIKKSQPIAGKCFALQISLLIGKHREEQQSSGKSNECPLA